MIFKDQKEYTAILPSESNHWNVYESFDVTVSNRINITRKCPSAHDGVTRVTQSRHVPSNPQMQGCKPLRPVLRALSARWPELE